MRISLRILALAACAAVLGAGLPARSQDDFLTELQLAVDRSMVDPRKLKDVDLKTVQAVLEKRTAMLALKGGKVEAKSLEDIRVKAPATKINDAQKQMIGRMGQLEVRELEEVRGPLHPKARYMVEYRSIQGEVSLRIRDVETNLPIPMERFLPRCPLLFTSEDLAPEGASAIQGLGGSIIRVKLKERAAKQLERLTRKPGRMLAIVIDGDLMGIPVVSQKLDAGVLDLPAAFNNPEEAGYLAIVLNSGALPLPFKVVNTRLVAE
jgi:preprotein translocase subunit SecD